MKKANKEPKLRSFVGIKFTLVEQIRPVLNELEDLALHPQSKLRVAPPDNLHITLKFLGPIPETQLGAVTSIVSQVVSQHKSMQLRSKGIGFFKSSIWLGIDNDDALAALALELDQAFALFGVSPELKAFIPHVTIARFNSDAKIKLSKLIDKYRETDWGTVEAKEVSLYRSDTLPEGARYTILESYPLIID